jgi:hypothetical protein
VYASVGNVTPSRPATQNDLFSLLITVTFLPLVFCNAAAEFTVSGVTFTMVMQRLPREVVDIIYEELGMTEQDVKDFVKILKEWLHKQPHLPHVNGS